VAHRAKESPKGRTNLFVVIDDDEVQRIRVGHIDHSGLASVSTNGRLGYYTELGAAFGHAAILR